MKTAAKRVKPHVPKNKAVKPAKGPTKPKAPLAPMAPIGGFPGISRPGYMSGLARRAGLKGEVKPQAMMRKRGGVRPVASKGLGAKTTNHMGKAAVSGSRSVGGVRPRRGGF